MQTSAMALALSRWPGSALGTQLSIPRPPGSQRCSSTEAAGAERCCGPRLPGLRVPALDALFPWCWWHLNPALAQKRHLFHFLPEVPSGNASPTEYSRGLHATSCVTP